MSDPNLELNGVEVIYPDGYRFKVARAGGANSEFMRVFGREMQPYRLAIMANELSTETAEAILARVYVRAVIKRWRGPDMPRLDDVGKASAWLLEHQVIFDDLKAVAEGEANFGGESRVYGGS